MDRPRPRFAVPTQRGRRRAGGPSGDPVRLPPAGPPPLPGHERAGHERAVHERAVHERAGHGHAGGDERFRALFEHAPVGVALSEPDGGFVDVNGTLRELLAGTPVDPDLDGPLDLVRHLPDAADGVVAWRQDLADVSAGRVPVARAEVPLPTACGPPRWVRATAVLVVLGDHRYLLTHVEETPGRRPAEQRLLRLALHDELTGLANRTLLADRLDAAIARDRRTGLRTGVLHVNLDGVEEVSDRLGHDVGDQLLVGVGRRLAATLRAGDTAGRVSGHEFLVIAGDLTDDAALGELMRRVTAALSTPLPVPGRRAAFRAGIGAALTRPGDTLTTVMRRAEADLVIVTVMVTPARRAGTEAAGEG